MGIFISTLMNHISKFYKTQQVSLLMVGIDGAGKTTILYKLKLGDVVQTIPTYGFILKTFEYHNVSFTVWDVGGLEVVRPLWRYYFQNGMGIIFVVDSNDPDRIEEARSELYKLLGEEEVKDAALLVLANKQDLPNAMPATEMAEKLQLNAITNRNWNIQSSCAKTGEGIYDGLDWLSRELQLKK